MKKVRKLKAAGLELSISRTSGKGMFKIVIMAKPLPITRSNPRGPKKPRNP